MRDKRNFLLFIAALIFIVFEGWMFYLIHLTEDGISFVRYYDCIIAATSFAWLTLFIKLIGAKRDGRLHTVLGIRDGNLLRIAMIFTLVACDTSCKSFRLRPRLSGVPSTMVLILYFSAA
jgi:hypothetical protein